MKHIFVGLDGTWQAAFHDPFHSNVFRLSLALSHEDKAGCPQLFFYYSGVGTHGTSRNHAGATGEGLDEIILQAYVNIILNYLPGDKIYLFGFSRGAVAARALAGFISYCGVLRANSSTLVETAWRSFTNQAAEVPFQQVKHEVTYPDAAISFLGVWDTVDGKSALEKLRKEPFNKLRFRNFLLDRIVEKGVHILALDDTRRYFRPMMWEGTRSESQVLEQIWMPGVHGDVGGGYAASFLSTISLLTMLDKLKEHSPDIKLDTEHYMKKSLYNGLIDQPPIVNDEWFEYKAAFFDKKVERQRFKDPAYRQSLHPITDLLIGADVLIKSNRANYRPSVDIADTPKTKFRRGSYYHAAIKGCSTFHVVPQGTSDENPDQAG